MIITETGEKEKHKPEKWQSVPLQPAAVKVFHLQIAFQIAVFAYSDGRQVQFLHACQQNRNAVNHDIRALRLEALVNPYRIRGSAAMPKTLAEENPSRFSIGMGARVSMAASTFSFVREKPWICSR